MPRVDLLAVGDVVVDHYFEVPRFPEAGSKVHGRFLGSFGGGMAGNVAAFATLNGIRCEVMATVGEDCWGRALTQELRARDIGTQWLATHPGDSGQCVIALNLDGEKSLVVAASNATSLTATLIARALAKRPQLVYTSLLEPKTASLVAEACLGLGISLAVDVEQFEAERYPELVESLALQARVFSCNSATTNLVPARPTGQLRVELRGAAGLAVFDDGDLWEGSPQPNGPVIDTTGGGDSVMGAVCAGWLRNEHLAEIGHVAMRSAAAAIGRVGARSRLPT